MENYKKAYFLLFNAMTDAQQHILRCQPEKALEKLMQAQQDAEEIIISDDEAGKARLSAGFSCFTLSHSAPPGCA